MQNQMQIVGFSLFRKSKKLIGRSHQISQNSLSIFGSLEKIQPSKID